MSETGKKSFWTTLPGLVTAIATLLTAIAGLIVAIKPFVSNKNNVLERNNSNVVPVSLLPVADAYTDSRMPNINYGNGIMIIGESDDKKPGVGIQNVYILYDLSKIISSKSQATVIPGSAKIRVFQGDRRINITEIIGNPVLENWDEFKITHNDSPKYDSSVEIFRARLIHGINKFEGVGLDRVVEDWLNNPSTNFGVVIRATKSNLQIDNSDSFQSREMDTPPQLVFQYKLR